MDDSVTLDDVEKWMAGEADPETSRRVSAAVKDPESDLSRMLEEIRGPTFSLLNQAFEARRVKGERRRRKAEMRRRRQERAPEGERRNMGEATGEIEADRKLAAEDQRTPETESEAVE